MTTSAKKSAALAEYLNVPIQAIGELVNEFNQFIYENERYLVVDYSERADELEVALGNTSFSELNGFVMSAGLLLAPVDGKERVIGDGFFAYLLEVKEKIEEEATPPKPLPPVPLKLYKVSAQLERRMCIDVTVEVRANDQYGAERIARDSYINHKLPVVHETSFYWADDTEFVVDHVTEVETV